MTSVEPTTETESSLSLLSTANWADQDPVLRDMWLRNESCDAIAGALGRSTAAIMTRAARLGLPRRAAPGRKSGYKRTEAVQKTRSPKKVDGRQSVATDRLDDSAARYAQPVPGQRVCLMCLNKFQSQGAHNRICPSCKGSSQYVAASGLPDMSFKVEH